MAEASLDDILYAFLAAQSDPALARDCFGETSVGIAVYANNTIMNRKSAMVEIFPTVRELVGEDFFEGLTSIFARHTPCTTGNLNLYHPTFGDFIVTFEHTQDLPYLADVARLDWAMQAAYYAADAAPIDPATLAQASDPETLRLHFHPSLALLASPYPVGTIWLAHHRGGEFPDTLDQPEHIMLWRDQGNRIQLRIMDAALFEFAGRLQAGMTLGEALDWEMLEVMGPRLQKVLAAWVGDGVLVGTVQLH
ncbi:putative DNA-binding domain-containing protein [Burkholderiaceae bacterium DAT-1]|nr:putative DNA-binding domain-containing protein [Burkholderiaceae bacterium DAT-1]